MSTLANTRLTLWDIAKLTDPSGKAATIVEAIMQENDIIDDIPWFEGNTAFGNVTTVRTGYQSAALRAINQGIVATKTTSSQINDACSIIEDKSVVDVDLVAANGAAYRAQEDKGKIAGMSETFASHLIYGNSADDPKEFNGFASRYFSLGSTYASTYNQVIDAGGTGSDNTSIYLVNWGEGRVSGIYPRGSSAGLQLQDFGIVQEVTNSTTLATMRAYVMWYQWKCGLAVYDPRSVVRICNIDISNLETASDGTDTSANILKYMSMAFDKIRPKTGGRMAFYMNERVRSMLRVKQINKGNAHITVNEIAGPNGLMRQNSVQFYGVPCRLVDAILNTESQITTAST